MNDTKSEVKKIFREYLKENFKQDPEKLKIYIYGHQLQICGGILKFEDELDITLIHQDLRLVGYKFFGHKFEIAEKCAPYPDNAVVLVCCIYPYQFENICNNLMKLGLKREQLIHAKSLSEKLLNISGEYFSQKAMDLQVKSLFDSIGRDISKIRYLDIGANMWLLYNNSYLFYRAGANGVLVEANPDFVDEIKKNRPRDNAVMCGCSDIKSEEEWTYYKTRHAGYNTFIKEIADTYASKGLDVQEIKIPMKYIGDILEENFKDGHIDFMSVDVEGMGTRIVDAIDFNRYDIDVILLEMDFDEEASRKIYMKLHELGYESRYRVVGEGKDFLFFKTEVFGSDLLPED